MTLLKCPVMQVRPLLKANRVLLARSHRTGGNFLFDVSTPESFSMQTLMCSRTCAGTLCSSVRSTWLSRLAKDYRVLYFEEPVRASKRRSCSALRRAPMSRCYARTRRLTPSGFTTISCPS